MQNTNGAIDESPGAPGGGARKSWRNAPPMVSVTADVDKDSSPNMRQKNNRMSNDNNNRDRLEFFELSSFLFFLFCFLLFSSSSLFLLYSSLFLLFIQCVTSLRFSMPPNSTFNSSRTPSPKVRTLSKAKFKVFPILVFSSRRFKAFPVSLFHSSSGPQPS